MRSVPKHNIHREAEFALLKQPLAGAQRHVAKHGRHEIELFGGNAVIEKIGGSKGKNGKE